jgi:putative ABC transport system substrate-binding protein
VLRYFRRRVEALNLLFLRADPQVIARRKLLAAFSAALATVALCARAQQPSKVWRVGFLVAGVRGNNHAEFERAMREFGYVEGRNLAIEWRLAEGRYERLPALATDLVGKNVDVIVTENTIGTKAAQRATAAIPIVMATVGDPVGSGFAATLARPGGNITGLSIATTDTSAKWLELVKIVVPTSSRVAILCNPGTPTVPVHLKNIQAAAQKLAVSALPVEARSPDEIERGFVTMARERPDAVIVLPDAMFIGQRERIAALAIQHRMPYIAAARIFAEAGALVSYGPNYAIFYPFAATYVDKIFKGARPSELAIEQPTIFELIINKKTAKALGQTIPQELMLRADAVIE